jgi:hypothetical protein
MGKKRPTTFSRKQATDDIQRPHCTAPLRAIDMISKAKASASYLRFSFVCKRRLLNRFNYSPMALHL